MIKIMADSTCDLSPEIVERYNIGIVPLNITNGKEIGLIFGVVKTSLKSLMTSLRTVKKPPND